MQNVPTNSYSLSYVKYEQQYAFQGHPPVPVFTTAVVGDANQSCEV